MNAEIELLFDEQLYQRVLIEELPLAKRYVWIATANLKNMQVPVGKKFKSILFLFDMLLEENVSLRLLCAENPSRSFDTELDNHPLTRGENFELQICPRNHSKIIIIDGAAAYAGSANITGAGIGAKSERSRNFECGIFTRDSGAVKELAGYFDEIWMGAHCAACNIRSLCPAPFNTI